ncbi:MAG: MCE family protein [Myxococcales bacterium]|nr:MCE family protein [Myxococcales bacterium]
MRGSSSGRSSRLVSLIRQALPVRRAVGALFLAALGGAIAAVLLTSGRTLGRGIHLEVELASTGALRNDARVKIAGRDVGEVRGMRRETVASGARHVIVDAFVAREWAEQVRRDSTLFVATPSILGEAYLEIGPPARSPGLPSLPPGAPVSDGDRLRGGDPPELDRFIAKVYGSLTTIGLLLRTQGPAWNELSVAAESLIATLAGLPADRGQLGRIRSQGVRAIDDALAIAAALDQAGALPRVRVLARDLGETMDHLGPELSSLGLRIDRAATRLDALSDLLPPGRREAARRALDALTRAAGIAERIAGDVKLVAAKIDRGEGTMGAFFADKEIFDDLHEVHRILKSQPWSVIVKPIRAGKTK